MHYPFKPTHKDLQNEKRRQALARQEQRDEMVIDFDELSIQQAFTQHRSISYKQEAQFPQQTLYYQQNELGQMRYYEILSARLNDFGRYTLEVNRWGSIWTLSIEASELVYLLKSF